MSNIINSQVRINGNDDCLNFLDGKIMSIEKHSIVEFAKTFYDDVPVVGDGIDISWSYDKLGSKWVCLNDSSDINTFTIDSGGYPPIDFLKHIYKMLSSYDESVELELTYSDEFNDSLGAVVLKNNKIVEKNLYDVVVPSEYIDDEVYEYIYEMKYKLLNDCNQGFEVDEYDWI
jgi:hypothetical protein